MDGGSRKGQEKWNIIPKTGSRRKSVGIFANSRVRDGDAWRCLYPVGIPACACYRTPMWIKLDTEQPIMPSRLDLAQARECWRFHGGVSTPMYENI